MFAHIKQRGQTSLHAVAEQGHVEVADLLLSKGAIENKFDNVRSSYKLLATRLTNIKMTRIYLFIPIK